MKFIKSLTGYRDLLLAGKPTKRDLVTLLIGTICAAASGVPFPLIGVIFGQLLDDFNAATCDQASSSGSGEQGSINSKILLIVYLAIAQFVTIYGHLLCWSLNGARLAQRLREHYLQTLLRQEPSYFDKLPPGEVASRLNGDIQTIRSGTAEKVGICLSTLSFFITAYIVAFIKDWQLAAILISLIPAYLLMSFVGSHYIEKYTGLMSDYATSATSIASEALSNIVVVHAFGANARLEEKFAASLEASEREGVKKATAVGVQSGVLYFVAYSANALAFWQGSKRIADAVQGTSTCTTVGAVFTVIFILIEATLLLSQVAPFLAMFSAASASYEKLREDLDRKPLIDGTSDAGIRVPEAQGAFEFKNVAFTYPSRPEMPVLEDFTLSIPAKKHTALVGLSGSGKSTIAGLVTRLYEPTAGELLFDGQDVRELNTHDLRGHLSLVQQEPSLLNRSLLENIAHGLVNSSNSNHKHLKPALLGSDLADLANELRDGKDLLIAASERGSEISEVVSLVQAAAVLADADEFITALQHGYGTLVGSGGRLISGGQKQRVALARALVKDPAVLVLDEATASLDSKSEQRIQQAINKIATGRTTITVAHRLSTITHADNIVVMHKGRIVEQGTHAALLAARGAYADLVGLQTLAATQDNADPSVDRDITGFSQSHNSSTDNEKVDFHANVTAEKSETASMRGEVTESEEESEEPETPRKSLWALAKGYAPTLRPHLLTIFVALLGSAIVGGAFSGEAVIFGNTVGALSPCKTPASIRSRGEFFGLMFFVLAIIEFFANLVSWAGFGWVSERIVLNLRVLSFRSLFEQDLQWHQSEGRSPALLLSYITRDGSALAGLSGSVIGTLISISINLVAAVILTHIIAWKIAIVCLALVPLLLGAGIMELRVLGQFEDKHENAYATSVDIGVEAITSIKTIASLSLEAETLATYQRSLDGPRTETLRVTLLASLCQAMMYFLGNLANALAYYWGSKQIVSGAYTQVQFLIVVFSLLVSALLWSQMFALAPELSSARAAMARILGLIGLGSDGIRGRARTRSLQEPFNEKDVEAVAEGTESHTSDGGASSVELRNTHFSYPARPDIKVLNGLSLDIRPGQLCALVGPSGAGKSTIISLVERLYSPQAGSVLVDGMDLGQTRSVAFRESISLVPQDNVLFEGSVEFNVGLGAKPGHRVTLEEVEDACKLANIHETIMALPGGYQTFCGPNGNHFSGGQKQRLSIARALVRKPKLLILDESTSALDAESEKLLQDGLDKATKHMTVIAIAHRLHTIRRADVIFLIEGGKCIARGTHEELMEKEESYRTNVMHQTVAT